MRHIVFGGDFASRPAATKDRKKHRVVGKVCPLNANPQELVLDLMATFWAPNRLHAVHSTLCKLRLKPSEKHYLKYNDPPTPNLKKLVSFKCPVGSINLTRISKQQRLVVSILGILDPRISGCVSATRFAVHHVYVCLFSLFGSKTSHAPQSCLSCKMASHCKMAICYWHPG